MSYIKHREITMITDATIDFTLLYEQMGEVIVNTSTEQTMTIKSATDAKGLWYRFINIDADATIVSEDNPSTPVAVLDAGASILLISDGVNWLNASDNKGDAGSLNVAQITTTDTLLVSQQGLIECNSETDITLNLPTAIGSTGLTYSITNLNTGNVTIEPFGSELLMGEANFILYTEENINITSNGTGWSVS